MASPITTVDAPTRIPRVGGIKSVAETKTAPNEWFAAQGLQFSDEGCAFPQLAPGLCFQVSPPVGTKTYGGITTLPGIVAPFGLYAGVLCFIGGTNYNAAAEKLLDDGWDRPFETRLIAGLEAADASTTTVAGVAAAVAAAEQFADANYLGRPTLVMSRQDLSTLNSGGAIHLTDGVPYTVNGTPVVATGSAAPAKFWITGAIEVYRSAVVTSTTIDQTQNREMAIAEAMFGATIDCNFVAEYGVS